MLQRKVCLVGDFAVGKTSLFQRFVYDRFSGVYKSTIGVQIQRKVVQVHAHDLTMVLWDTDGGKDGTTTVRESYLAGVAGAVIVCDLTRVSTILHGEAYAQSLRKANPQVFIVLAGNKLDLLEENHPHHAVVRQVSKHNRLPMTLTSASTGAGVEEMFHSLGAQLLGMV